MSSLSRQFSATFLTDSTRWNVLNEKFRKRYRFSKETVHMIVARLHPELRRRTNRHSPLITLQQVTCTLRFYATGSYQRVIGDCSDLNQGTVRRTVRCVSHAIALLKPEFIKMPTGEEQARTSASFALSCGFPGVIGAIDCTHVAISTPAQWTISNIH